MPFDTKGPFLSAGVKGKVNLSLAHGLPVVGTSTAVEGMFLEDGKSIFVADTPSEFAAAVAKIYLDSDIWECLSIEGIKVMEKYFSFNAARNALFDLVGK